MTVMNYLYALWPQVVHLHPSLFNLLFFFSTNFVLAGCSEAGWFWVTLINRKWHLGKLAEAVLGLEIRNWNKKSNIKMILDTKSCSVCHTRTVCRKEITNHCISYKEYLKIWHVDISPCHFYNSVHARLSMLTLAYTVCFIATEFASANHLIPIVLCHSANDLIACKSRAEKCETAWPIASASWNIQLSAQTLKWFYQLIHLNLLDICC